VGGNNAGPFSPNHPDNRGYYNQLWSFHSSGGRRPWFNSVFPLQHLIYFATPHDPYRLLAASVMSGNRHALPPLVDLLKRRDNPAGWSPIWSALAKAMEERTGDLPPDEVFRRAHAIATATEPLSADPAGHGQITEGIVRQNLDAGRYGVAPGDPGPMDNATPELTGYGALADHVEENGLPQYAQLLRAELANVLPQFRWQTKGRRRFSRQDVETTIARAIRLAAAPRVEVFHSNLPNRPVGGDSPVDATTPHVVMPDPPSGPPKASPRWTREPGFMTAFAERAAQHAKAGDFRLSDALRGVMKKPARGIFSVTPGYHKSGAGFVVVGQHGADGSVTRHAVFSPSEFAKHAKYTPYLRPHLKRVRAALAGQRTPPVMYGRPLRYAHYGHSDFLARIAENPDDTNGIRIYADWLRDKDLHHTAEFVERAANLDDPRKYNYRMTYGQQVPYDVGDAPRFASRISHGGYGDRGHSVELWQRGENGYHGTWMLHGLTNEEAADWMRRLRAEGAEVLLFERNSRRRRYAKPTRGRQKVAYVMREFEAGRLKSSSGETITDRKQAIAVALSEAGLSRNARSGGPVRYSAVSGPSPHLDRLARFAVEYVARKAAKQESENVPEPRRNARGTAVPRPAPTAPVQHGNHRRRDDQLRPVGHPSPATDALRPTTRAAAAVRQLKRPDRPLRLAADHYAVHGLLSTLTPTDRYGGPHADHTKRGVIADYLTELGRDVEGDRLRNPDLHVMIHPQTGEVVPAQFNLHPVRRAYENLIGHLHSGNPTVHPYPFDFERMAVRTPYGQYTMWDNAHGNLYGGLSRRAVHAHELPGRLADLLHETYGPDDYAAGEDDGDPYREEGLAEYHHLLDALRHAPVEQPLLPTFPAQPAEEGAVPFARRDRPRRYNREAFETAIDQNPLESLNHLAYADWLDENGEPGEAAFRRAMGNWIQESQGKDLDSPLGREATRFPFLVDRDHPTWTHSIWRRYLPTWAADPNAPEGVSERFYGRLRSEPHLAYAPNSFWLHWRNRRDMEEGLRRAFMKHGGESPPTDPPLAPERYAAYKAPPGGAVVRGTYFKGGRMIPDLAGSFANPPRATAPRKPGGRLARAIKRAKAAKGKPLVVSYGGGEPTAVAFARAMAKIVGGMTTSLRCLPTSGMRRAN
jgi:uncharacterized protein (TIGR02996 family)